jgi:pyrrolysyl-tRNA synthetase-like protein
MSQKYTVAQIQRLVELNAAEDVTGKEFETVEERNSFFKEVEARLVRENRGKLSHLLKEKHLPLTLAVEDNLSKWLTEEVDFTRVATPIIITSQQLEKMGITAGHPLREQVFWVENNKCLRPMHAPNLYGLMRDIYKITGEPVRIFEAGSCFRKESQGAKHMNEFTMLNLVELAGVKEGEQLQRLEELAHGAMKAVGIEDYEIVVEKSEVYGETVDIEVDGVEMASGAYGPHPLDGQWGIFDTWVGIGFGLERIAMMKGNYQTIKRAGKSLAYLDGVPLKL